MVGHTFSKLYATALDQWLSDDLECRISELKDMPVSARITRRPITFSHSEPFLRRPVIALRGFIVVL
jgi:hypothetical protein